MTAARVTHQVTASGLHRVQFNVLLVTDHTWYFHDRDGTVHQLATYGKEERLSTESTGSLLLIGAKSVDS